jgi:hypothetical protein
MHRPNKGETGGWRRLHNDQHYNLFSSLCVIMVITLEGIKVQGQTRKPQKKLSGNREESVGDLNADDRIVNNNSR